MDNIRNARMEVIMTLVLYASSEVRCILKSHTALSNLSETQTWATCTDLYCLAPQEASEKHLQAKSQKWKEHVQHFERVEEIDALLQEIFSKDMMENDGDTKHHAAHLAGLYATCRNKD